VKTLENVKGRFEAWRRTRKKQGPIPEALWQDAIQLLQSHSQSQVAKALRVNATELKKKANMMQSPGESFSFSETSWREVSLMAKTTQADHWTLILEHPNGFHLRLQSPHFNGTHCEGLIKLFLG
jgi:hypothetical protein